MTSWSSPSEGFNSHGNKASHFKSLLDSMRVTFVLARFYLSSILATSVDFGIFALAYRVSANLFGSLILSRFVAGGLINFAVNRSFVFHNSNRVRNALLKFYVLLTFSSVVSFFLLRTLLDATGWNVLLCRLLVDGSLSLINFSIQRTFVFSKAPAAAGDEQLLRADAETLTQGIE